MYYATDYISPLGRVKLAADGEALIGLWLEGQKYFGGKVKEEFVENRSLPVLENAKDWLNRYFAGKKPEISELPIAPMGSAFQRGVWELLCEIPYGQVTTYGEIAKKWRRGWEKAACPARRSEGRSATIRSLSLSPATGL